MYICQLKDIDEAVCTGYFDVASRMINNLIQEIEETNEQHEWVGLTEQDIHDAFQFTELVKQLSFSRERQEWCENFAAYIEAKLKEKNT